MPCIRASFRINLDLRWERARKQRSTGNDHLELVGLVEVRPGDGARTKAIGCRASKQKAKLAAQE